MVLQCICTAAIKVSVESVVESVVSPYEKHFDSSKQTSEENSLDEMVIAENDQLLLERAMNKYWMGSNNERRMAFYTTDERYTFLYR